MNVSRYDELAGKISVDHISRNSNNRIVLRRLQRNYDDDIPTLRIGDEDYEEGYFPEGAIDMGWLGYFVGKNNHLEQLVIEPFTPTSGTSVRDVIEPFFRGVCNNKSIHSIRFVNVDNMLGGEMFTMLGSFFKNNHNLTNINVTNCNFGDEGARLFALAIGKCTHKSLQYVNLQSNNIAEEGMVDIITALATHPELTYLDLDGNSLRKNGCVALATLLRCSVSNLQNLYIYDNEISDDGIEALVPALTNCIHLKNLYLSNNPSITTRGWQVFATILGAPNFNLLELYIASNNVDDEAVAAFANALVNNNTLNTCYVWENPSITNIGWKALAKALCNTSSVDATFLSNHTLQYMGNEVVGNAIIGPLLDLNRRLDKKEVAVIKILQNHAAFDMQPFFEWEFKILPLVISWLERASSFRMPRGFVPNIEERKLSTIYQLVRGMPVLYVEIRLRKELEDIKAEESKLEKEKMKLHEQSEERKQYLQDRKELLEERKKCILKKIGKPNVN